MRLVTSFILVAVTCACVLAAAPPAREPAEWLRLIDQLGEEDDDVRKAAQEKLTGLGEEVLPTLHRAAKGHADVDVRLRAGALVSSLEKALFGVARSFPAHDAGVVVFALSPDGKFAATSAGYRGKDRSVHVWRVADGEEVMELEGHGEAVSAIAWSSDGERLLSADGEGVMILWDPHRDEKLRTLRAPRTVYSVALTPDCQRAISCGLSRTITVWDLKTGKAVASNSDHKEIETGIRTVRLTPDGKQVVSAGGDGTVRLIDVETGKQVWKMDVVHKRGAVVAVPSADGTLVASGGVEGPVYLCDAKTGKRLMQFTGHDKAVLAIAFSGDGRKLVTGGHDRAMRVWEVATGRLIQRFDDAHRDLISGVAVLPGDRTVLTGSLDRAMKVWKIRR